MVSLDAMPNYPHILFNKSPEELRRQGARGGRTFGRNNRARHALIPTSHQPTPPRAAPTGNHGRSHHHPQRTVSMAACCGKARVRPTNNVKRDNPARGYCDFKLRGTLNILKPPPTKSEAYMLETYLTSAVTRRRLHSGPAAHHVDAFADWLRANGYQPISIENTLRSLAGWTDWMLTAGFTAQHLLPAFEAGKVAIERKQSTGRRRGLNRHSLSASSLFIRFLQHQGELPPPIAPPSSMDLWPILSRFCSWMRQHRGLTESTLAAYSGILSGLLETLGDDPRTYSAEALRAFVLDRAQPHRIERAKSIVVAVRSFVRFLGVTGQCAPALEQAIPGFASWQLASIPRLLAAEDVERMIGTCTAYRFGLRDRPVLLLLARLGLRASEVAQLRFADIDWANGVITVIGKGRRERVPTLASGGGRCDSPLSESGPAIAARY